MRIIYQLQIWLYIFIIPIFLSAQEEVLHFHRLTTKQQLTSQNYNYYILKDSKGFVWISSVNGLNRYDGRHVKSYLPIVNDSLSLTESNIHSMFFEDEKNRLWFSTSKAIQCYDPEKDYFYRDYIKGEDGVNIEDGYQLLYLDTLKKEAWVKIGNQLYIKSIINKNKQVYVDSFPMNHRTKLEKAKNTSDYFLIIPKTDGLYTWLLHNGQVAPVADYPVRKRLAGMQVLSHYFEGEEHVWAGTGQGLVHLNLIENDSILYADFFGNNVKEIVGIVPFDNDYLLVATKTNGIYYFNKMTRRFTRKLYMYDDGTIEPFQPTIDKIYIDKDNTLWVSTYGEGVYFTNLKKKKFQPFLQNTSDEAAPPSYVRAMTEDNFGRIWCLTDKEIITCSLNGRNNTPRIELRWKNLPFIRENPFYIYCDRGNRIWVCTSSGLYVLRPNETAFLKVQADPALRLEKPGFLFVNQLSNDKILAASQSNGVFEIVEEKEQFFVRRLPALASLNGDFGWMYEDSKGRAYFYKNSGSIYIYRQARGELYFDTTLLLEPMVNALVEDQNGQHIWVATMQGLFRIERSNESYKLSQDTVFVTQSALNGLLQDDDGRLWISTNNSGLIRYTPGKKGWRVYQQSEGLQSSEFNFWSFIKTRKRLFGFGGVNGVNFFYPTDIEDLNIAATPVITAVLINDNAIRDKDLICKETNARNISYIKKLVLPYSKNTLSFRFAALEYSDPSANQFSYQLKNVDDTLVNIGTENFARYANLRPGNYIFEVHATNSDGVWSDKIAQLAIRIKPPWWGTWWARILFFIAGSGIVYAIYRNRIQQIREREEYLRKEAEFRQLIAETETAVLRLQMNPHFIFNSMNSIQSYILKKDIDTASDYLTRFAKLMRMILTFAEKQFICVAEEVELLEQYLKTEAMRLEKKFTYCFDIASDLDQEEVLLPTMVLQPFVENAIWHGISPKEGEGQIRIQFWQEAPYLFCSIEDNGIGRAAAEKNKPDTKKHESKALSITARRLKLLENETGMPGAYHIIDLFDETGAPSGTKIVIQIPLF